MFKAVILLTDPHIPDHVKVRALVFFHDAHHNAIPILNDPNNKIIPIHFPISFETRQEVNRDTAPMNDAITNVHSVVLFMVSPDMDLYLQIPYNASLNRERMRFLVRVG